VCARHADDNARMFSMSVFASRETHAVAVNECVLISEQ